jgi:hypothetical protein
MEAIKGCSSKLFGGWWILLVKISNLAFSMSEICCRFPGVGAFFIAFPFDSILELSMENMGIHDLVNFVLFFTFHCNRVRQRRLVKTVVLIRSKMVDVENGVEL